MRFASKNKGYFLEQNEHSVLLARTSSSVTPLVIEQLSECAIGDTAGLEQSIKQIYPKKTASNYLNAQCGVYPTKRLVRRASLEIKRLKEPAYFAESDAGPQSPTRRAQQGTGRSDKSRESTLP